MCRTFLLLTVLATVVVADEAVFDFHSVRGRQSKPAMDGRYEGEDLTLNGTSRIQGMKHYGTKWSGDAHLLWDGVEGESMNSIFYLPDSGTYELTLALTVAPDYGIFDFRLNDQVLEEGIDLYFKSVDQLPVIKIDQLKLQKGDQRVQFTLKGGNRNAVRFRKTKFLLGVDYLQLRRLNPPDEVPAVGATRVADKVEPLTQRALQTEFRQHCWNCHGAEDPEGGLDLTKLNSPARLLEEIATTRKIRNALARFQMPPRDSPAPQDQRRAEMVAALDSVIDDYLAAHVTETPVTMRRLNRYEYNNAVRDLLQLKGDIYPLPEKTIRAGRPYFDPASGHFPHVIQVGNRTLGKNQVERQILTGVSPFSIDLQAEGGFNNRGEDLSVSPLLLETFLTLGQSILNSPEFDDYCRITPTLFRTEQLTKAEQTGIARERLRPFLTKAFRQRVSENVLDRYVQFFDAQVTQGHTFSQAMKSVVAAVLASPRFIYLSESSADSLPLTELATRLSFFLWSTIPDDELLQLALDGSLARPDVLDAQVIRMLEDPRCQSLSLNFARQWMRLDQLITAVPDFDRYPRYYSRIGCEQWKFGLQTMIEPLLLFESIMVEDRSIMLLIDSRYSYRSDELQSWYKDDQPFAGRENRNRFNTNQQAYRRRELKTRREGGLITTAATLTMTSAPLRTSPIVRGAWVATVIFNQPPPPPPDDVPPIEADEQEIEANGLTLRQRLVQHQVNQSCAACHSKIDPLGFALENFDAVGRWRDNYQSGLKIDATGTLFGTEQFTDVVSLKDAILKNPEWFFRAFSEHLLSYALGRELEIGDRPAVDQIVSRAIADHGQFSTIVKEVVRSQPFRNYVRQ